MADLRSSNNNNNNKNSQNSTEKRLPHLGSTLRLPDSRLYKKLVTTLGPKEDGTNRNGSIFSNTLTHGPMAQLTVLASDKRG